MTSPSKLGVMLGDQVDGGTWKGLGATASGTASETGSASSVLVGVVIAIVVCVIVVVSAFAVVVISGGTGPEGRRISPFSAVRSVGLKVEVRIEGEFHELRSINGVVVEDLVVTAQEEFDDKWVRRLGEDLDAVFLARGAPMACPATVEIFADGERESRTLDCTGRNRELARNYNRAND